jgi:pectin methylesterase-like acyl-CoA thioesterase
MRSTTKWWLTAATALATAGFALSAPGSALADTDLDVCPSGCTYSTIQSAVDAAGPGDTVAVGAGTYDEKVTVSTADLTLQGANPATTTISAPGGSGGATVQISAAGVTLSGFTLTRDGNNPTDWDNNLAFAGVAIQTVGNATISGNPIAGNRTAIDVNNSSGNTITADRITNNRSGLIFRNVTDNTTVSHNWITDNWTVGVLFLDASGGTNSPEQHALNSHFTDNDISGNWYGQIVDRQAGGALPAPGTTNLKDFARTSTSARCWAAATARR